MRRIPSVLLLTASASVAMAQLPIPPTHPTVTITVDSRIKSLNYDQELEGPWTVEGSEGSFVRVFTFEAVVGNLPEGWSIVSYEWGPTWEPGDLVYPTSVLTFAPGTSSPSAQGTAWITGWGYPQVTVTFLDHLGTLVEYGDDEIVAAIGGSLDLSGFGEELPTWTNDEDDESNPINLQFLGHSPVDVPDLYQIPRKGKFRVRLGQPTGTQVTLSTSGPIVVISEEGTEMIIGATAESGTGGIVPSGHFALTFDGSFGEGDDCNDQMPNPESYKFTSHKPESVELEFHSYQDWNGVDGMGTFYGKSLREYFKLKDHLGQLMPGIAIQERFDPNFDPALIYEVEVYWETLLEPPGRTNGVDHMGLRIYGAQYTFAEFPNDPYVVHRQLLVAGTADRTWYGADGHASPPGGVPLAYFKVYKWTDTIIREREGG